MRVLIIEDNAFNAFCLRRLVESVIASVSVTIVNNSHAALSFINSHCPDIVVIDGDLGAMNDEMNCNGPELAGILLKKYPQLPIIAWSDSDTMREDFTKVFKTHGKLLNEYNSWAKVIGQERIYKTWAYYFGEFMIGQNSAFTNQTSVSYF
ncbi:histidine kinase [Legionella norrlandica]|uniref:Histidine kinase n=1 Tax=Legionella norrlandica TaxID=1498499 RepID=A0A0A2SUA8_9GAMM|nr:response regulator [Legionella norrlandica]KGP62999.1 histidine kinase [Legionella norrlandica]